MKIEGVITERRHMGQMFFASVRSDTGDFSVGFRRRDFDEATWSQVILALEVGDRVAITAELRNTFPGVTSVRAEAVRVVSHGP